MPSIHAYTTKKGRRYLVAYTRPTGGETTKRGFATKKAAELWAADNTVAIATGSWVDGCGRTEFVRGSVGHEADR